MVKSKIMCRKCGFETTLVCVDGKWKCDIEAHGNGAPGKKCFNCQAKFDEDGQNIQETAKDSVPADEVAALIDELEKVRAKNVELKAAVKAAEKKAAKAAEEAEKR